MGARTLPARRQLLLLGDERPRKREHMGNQEIGSLHCCRQVLEARSQVRHHSFADDETGAAPEIEHLFHHLFGFADVGHVGAHRRKTNSLRLDFLAIEFACGDDGLVPSPLQLQSNGDVGMQVAQRSERGQYNAPGTGLLSCRNQDDLLFAAYQPGHRRVRSAETLFSRGTRWKRRLDDKVGGTGGLHHKVKVDGSYVGRYGKSKIVTFGTHLAIRRIKSPPLFIRCPDRQSLVVHPMPWTDERDLRRTISSLAVHPIPSIDDYGNMWQ